MSVSTLEQSAHASVVEGDLLDQIALGEGVIQELTAREENLLAQQAGIQDALREVREELAQARAQLMRLQNPTAGLTTLHALGLGQPTIDWLFTNLGILHVDQLTHYTHVSFVNRGEPRGLTEAMLVEIKQCLTDKEIFFSEQRVDKAA
jgi:hypothetical protein